MIDTYQYMPEVLSLDDLNTAPGKYLVWPAPAIQRLLCTTLDDSGP